MARCVPKRVFVLENNNETWAPVLLFDAKEQVNKKHSIQCSLVPSVAYLHAACPIPGIAHGILELIPAAHIALGPLGVQIGLDA